MSEDVKPVDQAPQVEAEAPQGEAAPETPQYTEIEQAALASGWQDKKAWVESGHDENDHRSAREFMDRGELLGKLRATSNEVKEMRQTLAAMTEHNRKVFQAGVEQGIKQLQAAKRAALKEGDFDNAAQIDEEIDKRKENLDSIKEANRRPQQQPQVEQSPEFKTWVSRNQWYLNDPVLHHTANALAIEFTKVNPNVQEQDVYNFLDKQMRKEFPHKFGKVTPPSPDSGSRRQGSGANSGGGGDFEKILSQLDPDEARMARRLVENKHLTKEKYVEDYKAIMKGRV